MPKKGTFINQRYYAKKLEKLEAILIKLGEPGEAIVLRYKDIKGPKTRLKKIAKAYTQLKREIEFQLRYKEQPVSIEEFVTSKEYMDMPIKPHMNEDGAIYPALLEELKNICAGDYIEVVCTGAIGCWPGDAEFLSDKGWIRFDEYHGEKVAEYNPLTEEVSFKESSYVELEADEWCELSNKTCFDMKVSPEHSVLLKEGTGKLRTVNMHSIVSGEVNRFSYKIPSTFKINKTGISLSEDEIRLMVAVIADGNFRKGLSKDNKQCRITLRKERKKKRLESLLKKLELPIRIKGPYSTRPTEVCYFFDAPLKTKKWEWAWDCNEHQLRIIFEEMRHWDGLHPDSTPCGEWRVHTTDKDTVDFTQYLCHATGHRSNVCISSNKGSKWATVSARLTTEKDYDLRETFVTKYKAKKGTKKYCFNTETGYFIARYKNVVQVSGNSAKTTISLILLAYHLYLLAVLRDPHREYSLLKSDEIVMIFQSLNAAHAKTVDYARFKAMIQNSKWFQENFMFNKNVESEMQFPNRVIVKPVSGSSTAAIGQNCISGLIDEINFMKITKKSKNTKDSGVYDQAMENYTSIVRRRESRFMKMGRTPGILCLVSSKRYPGEFTDRKIEEAKTNKKIYIYDKKVWDISPPGRFCGDMFKVFCGDMSRKPRILLPHEVLGAEDQHLIQEVPVEYKKAFEDDLLGSLRDIAGRSTQAIEPYILDVERVSDCFGKVDSILSREDCDFKTTKVYIYPNRIKRKDQPRFVHIDLGLTNDCAGVACGYVAGFVNVTRGREDEQILETLPVIVYDFILEVKPPPNGEISFYKIRDLLYKLGNAGMQIKWVTLDSWQAIDTIQILRRKGYKTGIQSMDTTMIPYDITKTAFMDGRINAPTHIKCNEEIISLEKDVKRGKIDHSPQGSKDLSDALAGVCYGLTMRREIWVRYGVPLMTVPTHLKEKANTNKNSVDRAYQEE